jgi:hypothetical protein
MDLFIRKKNMKQLMCYSINAGCGRTLYITDPTSDFLLRVSSKLITFMLKDV